MATNPFSLPSSYQQELTGIDRRRQLAQSLLQNSMQPQQGQMVSGHYVSPGIAGGIGQILGAYLANKGINTADQQEKMVTDRYNTDRNKVLAEALQAREGVPAQMADNPQPEGVDHAGTVQAAVPGSNKKMAEILAGSQFPELQQMGMTQLFKGPDKPIILGRTAIDNNGKVIAVDSTWQEEQKAAREAKQAELEARLEDQRLSRQDRAELQKQLVQMQIESRKDLARFTAANRPERQEQVIQTENGPMRLVNGQAIPITDVSGQQVKSKGVNAEKILPTSAAGKLLENRDNLRKAETALDLLTGKNKLDGDPNATGWKGYLPNTVLNRVDSKGVATRAAISDIGSMVIHDRSGAAVSASEFPRLRPFIPSATDDYDTAKTKLERFVKEFKALTDDTESFYKESGYKVPGRKSAGASSSWDMPQTPQRRSTDNQPVMRFDAQGNPLP